ncbi:MAG: FHA domain-containing protein [Planctomycetes bacterium]|nr:FHA domain-containing protein [Planctomycetota bacterium]
MPPEKDNGKAPSLPRPVNPVVSTLARARLDCIAGPEKGQTLRVAPNVTVIGRDPSCDVILSETAISRQHCRIDRRPDHWVLANLSANGTLLNKKPVDEAALGDGDEIRLGAKTRLRFVVESVPLSSTGRPQFRRRTGAPEEAAAEEGQPEEVQEGKPSVFKRRKSLFIGLGIYLGVMLIVFAYFAYSKIWNTNTVPLDAVPTIGLDDTVRPAPGVAPLRIDHEDERGIWAVDARGQTVLVPAADLESGKARRITGIRKSVDVKFLESKNAPHGYPYTIEETNTEVGKQCQKQALELYRVRNLPGKETALYSAVRLFQKALAYHGGRGYFDDTHVNKIYREALQKFIDTIDEEYRKAVILEEADKYKQAYATYRHILDILPERENPVYTNAARRADMLRRRHPDLM